MEKENQLFTSEEKNNVPGPSCLGIIAGTVCFIVVFAVVILFAMAIKGTLNAGVGLIDQINESQRIERTYGDPKNGEVQINRDIIKVCDGTTLLYKTSSPFSIKLDPIPNSSQCQPSPP